MKIIYYSPHPTHDIVSEVGYSTHQRETIIAFKEAGNEVLPVILGGNTPAEKKVFVQKGLKFRIKEGVKFILPPLFWNAIKDLGIRKHDKFAGAELEKAILEFEPDLIYERSEYMQNSGVNIAQKHRVKHFLELNAPFMEEMKEWEGASLMHKYGHKLEKEKFEKTTHIFVVSTALKQFVQSRYRINESKISVIPNCIRPDGVKVNAEIVKTLKTKYNPESKKVIGFVGSIFPHHGINELIEAFAATQKVGHDALLMIVGGGMNEAEIKEKAKKECKPGSVIFTGKVPHHEVFNYIELMDITVMPKSNWYGSPMKIFEYGILGKAVVAPDNIPVRDAMVHLQDGYLIDNNPDSLQKAFEYLFNHPKEMKEMGASFRNKILENFTWKKQAEMILNLKAEH